MGRREMETDETGRERERVKRMALLVKEDLGMAQAQTSLDWGRSPILPPAARLYS